MGFHILCTKYKIKETIDIVYFVVIIGFVFIWTRSVSRHCPPKSST